MAQEPSARGARNNAKEMVIKNKTQFA